MVSVDQVNLDLGLLTNGTMVRWMVAPIPNFKFAGGGGGAFWRGWLKCTCCILQLKPYCNFLVFGIDFLPSRMSFYDDLARSTLLNPTGQKSALHA
jgi:hypothetical protein